MLNVRNATLNVAAVFVIVAGLLSLLTTLPQTLLSLSATPAPQAAASSVATTTEISATNTTTPTAKPVPPRAGPNPLIIRGEKGALLQTNWNDVTYRAAPLVVWSIDPSTMAPTDTIANFVVSWQPAASADNIVPLDVRRDGSACLDLASSNSQHSPSCYTVSATRAVTMGPGIYTSTLYISDNAGTESAVTVKVLIGRSLWVLLIVVALGVIVTEWWLLWRRTGQYDLGWASRRKEWLDNLSKNLKWTRPFEQPADAQQAERDALQVVKTELRTATSTVSTWLEQGQAGTLTLQDLPNSDDAIKAKVDPLLEIAQRHLKPLNSLQQELDKLTNALKAVSIYMLPAVEQHRTNSVKALNTLYNDSIANIEGNYSALKTLWETGSWSFKLFVARLIRQPLLRAMGVIQEIWSQLGNLQQAIATLDSAKPVSLAAEIVAIEAVIGHLKLLDKVVEKARFQQSIVSKIAGNPLGKAETEAFLNAVNALSPAKAKSSLQMAQQPLALWHLPLGDLLNAINALKLSIDRVTNPQISNLGGASQLLKTELLTAVRPLSSWLDRGRAGTLTLQDLLVSDDVIQAKVNPLSEVAQRYYEAIDPLKQELDDLTKALNAICTSVAPAAKKDREASVNLLVEIYEKNVKNETAQGKTIINQKYGELADKWKSQASQDNKLLEAWGAAQEIWSQLLNLQQAAAALKSVTPVSLADEVSAVRAVVDHLAALNAGVITKAQQQLAAISLVAPTTQVGASGSPASAASAAPATQAGASSSLPPAAPVAPSVQEVTASFLKEVLGLGPLVKAVEQPLQRAQQPLKYALPSEQPDTPGLFEAINQLKKALKAIDDKVAILQVSNLNDDAIQSVLLATAQKGLKSIDDALGDSTKDVAGLWAQIQTTHRGQARFIQIGSQILRMKDLVEKAQYADVRPKVMPYLHKAYRHLLNGRVLDAEVAMERAHDLVDQEPIRRILNFMRLGKLYDTESVQRFATRKVPYKLVLVVIGFFAIVAAIVITIIVSVAIGLLVWLLIRPLFDRLPFVLQLLARFDWQSPFLYVLITPLVIAAILFVIRLLPQSRSTVGLISALIGETTVLKAFTLLGKFASGTVSLAIAVTVIVAAREATLKDSLSTWGTNLDILVAFTWGAVAHRLLQSLQSAWSGMQSTIQGDKPAADTTKAAEGK